jgi:thioredoxin
MKAASLLMLMVLTIALTGCGQSPPPESSVARPGVEPFHLTDVNFQAEVLESEVPVLVDMWAPWCQSCIAMKPTLRQLASELSGSVKVAELNVAENPFIKHKYDVDKYPMLLVFVGGNEVQRLDGARSREELLAVLSDHVAEEKLR